MKDEIKPPYTILGRNGSNRTSSLLTICKGDLQIADIVGLTPCGDEDGEDVFLSDEENRELAQWVLVALNSHERLVELAREIAKPYEDAADWKDARGRLYAMATAALLEVEREGGMGR